MIKTNNEKSLSLMGDIDKVVSLIKDGSLIDAIADEFLKLENLSYQPVDGAFFIIFWNRFDNQLKLEFNLDHPKKLEKTPHPRDFLSWIPLLVSNSVEIRRERALINSLHKEADFEMNFPSFKTLKDNRSVLKEFLSKKIVSKLLKDQKAVLKAVDTNDWEFYFNKVKRGERYPIDLLPVSIQNDDFLARTELFYEGDYSSISNRFSSSLYQSIPSETSHFLVVNENLELNHPYDSMKNQLVELVVEKIQSNYGSFIVQNKMIQFIQKIKETDPELPALRLFKEPMELFYEAVENYFEKLKTSLFKAYCKVDSDPYKMIGEQLSLEEKEVAKNFLDKKLNDFLYENRFKAATYHETLNFNTYYQFKQNNFLVESFSSLKDFDSAVSISGTFNKKLVYCPLYKNLASIKGLDKNGYDYLERTLKEKAVTTQFVKDEIKKVLSLSFVNLKTRFRSHLEFVLNELETIEV